MKKRCIDRAVLGAVLLLLAAGCGNDPTGPSETPDGWQEYTVDGFTFQWLVEDSTGTLRVRMSAPTTGWLAVGFDPSSFMEDANLIIGYVDGSAAQVRDDFGTGPTSHSADTDLPDGTDDATLVSGSESSGTTEIEFSIPLDSGDAYDRVLSPGTTYAVIFARGANGADDFTSQHVWAASAALEI